LLDEKLEQFEKQQLKYNKISAWSALIASLATAVGIFIGSLGVYLAWQSLTFTKEMESLRFRPHITIHSGSTNDAGVLISLKNNGPGAALIESIELWNDQHTTPVNLVVNENKPEELTAHVVRAVFGEKIQEIDANQPHLRVRIVGSGEVLSNGDSMRILSFDPENTDTKFEDLFNTAIAVWTDGLGGHIRVKYCSLDGNYCDVQSD